MSSPYLTSSIELTPTGLPQHTQNLPSRPHNEPEPSRPPRVASKTTSSRISNEDLRKDFISSLPAPATVSERLERWNQPRSNIARSCAAFWSLMVMGMNDAAYGAIIPYMVPYYNLSYTLVSLIFLSPFMGYALSAFMINWMHNHFGQRGIAILSSGCHLVAYIISVLHPPYPVLVVVYALAGFGNGLGDAAWNAWMGAMANANEVLGVMHAFYGLGGTLAPLISTAMVTQLGMAWYEYYYLMFAVAAVEALALGSAFWPSTGQVFRDAHPRSGHSDESIMHEALLQRPAARVSWLCAGFLLCYVGVEVALGGWIVTFMMNVRHGAPFASGMTATGFWLGLTMGRLVLGFVTPRLGERLALMMYLPAAMGLEVLFWLVPQFVVSAVSVALQGFLLGPLFPTAVVAATKLLPKHLHVSTIGFAAALGSGGAAVFPFAVGAIAQSKGVGVLQPIVLTLLVVLLALWLALPNFNKIRA